MKKFVLSLSLFVFFCANVWGQTQDDELNSVEQRTDVECAETLNQYKGKFSLPEKLNNRMILCLTRDTNKKLNNAQIEKLDILSRTWKNVINDLYREGNFQINFESSIEFSLQLAVRIYNLIYNKRLPECAYEANNEYADYYNEPCNSKDIIEFCKNTNSTENCLKQKLVSAIEKFADEKHQQKALSDVNNLIKVTEDFLSSINITKAKLLEEKIRLLNFYYLSVIYTDKITNLWDKTANE